jgi:(2Fe-2S) ferredoxin
MSGSVYERHVFVCTAGEWCPAVDGDGLGVHARLKGLVKAAGVADRVRINNAGCFSQCGHGPMVVVYPDDVWYAAVTPDDADEIFRSHLIGGRPVERLRYRAGQPGANKLPRDAEGRAIGRPR